MMIVLVAISVFTYSARMAVRRAAGRLRPPAETPVIPELPIASVVDPAYYWRGDSAEWTAADERQLIKLLNDSSP